MSVSVARPGGPMEPLGDGRVKLHPGRYFYSDTEPGDSAFNKWLVANPNITVTATDTAKAVLHGDDYYTNYDFKVPTDTIWDMTLKGLPTFTDKQETLEEWYGEANPESPESNLLGKALKLGAIGAGIYIAWRLLTKSAD